MHPYETIRLSEYPDVHDIQTEGRKSIIGRLKRDHGYIRRPQKALVRRHLKRADKALSLKREHEMLALEERQNWQELLEDGERYDYECGPKAYLRYQAEEMARLTQVPDNYTMSDAFYDQDLGSYYDDNDWPEYWL